MSQKIAVVGAGFIGRSWAMVFSKAGHHVSLYDIEINNSSMAIASKDSSAVKVERAKLNKNDIDLGAYNKKPEFEGGKILIDKYAKLNNLKIFPVNVGKDNLEKSLNFYNVLGIKNLKVYLICTGLK